MMVYREKFLSDELIVYVFPELKSQLKDELHAVQQVRHQFKKLSLMDLKQKFLEYDTNRSGGIGSDELRHMFESLNIQLSAKGFELLLASVVLDDGGNLTFQEFIVLVAPTCAQGYFCNTYT
jgi:Ca2+-binding EF-hand superfamily protein